jgi:hypothetical protein
MKLDRYLILPAGDQWAVRLDTKILKTFRSKTDAIRAAIDAARRSGEIGIAAAVMSQRGDGAYVSLWTFGQDGYTAGT